MRIKQLPFFLLICTTIFVACKKNKANPTPAPVTPVTPPPITPPTRGELSRDSIFLYAKQIYFWNDVLPTIEVFNPRRFTTASTDFANYQQEVFAISQISVNSATGRPFEFVSATSTRAKYSYVSDKSLKNPTAYIPSVSAVDLEGNGNDLGARIGLYAFADFDRNTNVGNYSVCIQAVYQNSPAEKAGLVRGDRITKMNGTPVGSNLNGEIDLINSFLATTTTSMTLEIVKPNGVVSTVTLNKAVYKSSPIYRTKIFTSGAKKIGYLAYARFSNMSNSQAELEAAFTSFANEGVSDLIIDLRYNGGGYVNTAQHLINLIAPSSLNGNVMMTEHFNSTMQNGQATILANQPLLDGAGKVQFSNGRMLTYADVNYSVSRNTDLFAKKGNLNNVSNVVFLVTSATASSSELVINSLRPHIKVTLVGLTTFGKPIGFFPITIENRYDVYFSLFQTRNSAGVGDFFAGFTPDFLMSEHTIPTPTTTPLRNFGDPEDLFTARALSILAPGITGFSNSNLPLKIAKKQSSIFPSQNLNSLVSPDYGLLPESPKGNEFIGMIETRHRLK
jgi:C-terminal processing protease CtpA/Prc